MVAPVLAGELPAGPSGSGPMRGQQEDFSPAGVEEASDAAAAKQPRPKGGVLFNASHCMYDVITAAVKGRGWRVVRSESKASTCNVHWIDECSINDWFKRVEPWMRINHFPGMHNALARKCRLARNMVRMQRLFPAEYNFIPDTWVLPDDMADLEKHFDETGTAKTIFIAKPDAGTQGRGIFLTSSLDRIKEAVADRSSLFVVQRYIARPMLIEGLKFDLRLYFLVAANLVEGGRLEPRYFLFKDGLVRLCTQEYVAPTQENVDDRCMHLTNYAINKKSKDFVQNDGDDDGAGSKRSLRWFMDWIEEQHGEKERTKLWNKLKGLCVKMALSVHPTLEAEYASALPKDLSGGAMGCRCFEILGVDVMLDTKRRPYLIEVNHLPSFFCDSPLDEDVKSRVIDQVLNMTCLCEPGDKQAYEADVMARKLGAGSPATTSVSTASTACSPTCSEGGASGSHSSPLDGLTFGDFERVYPAPPDAPKAAARYERILARVSEVFRPVAAAKPRPGSSSLGPRGPQRPEALPLAGKRAPNAGPGAGLPPRPRLPPGGCRPAPGPPATSPGGSVSIVRRSLSAPVRQRQSPELPALPTPHASPSGGLSPVTTPRGTPGQQPPLPLERTASEAPPRARSRPPQLPQRQSLPMASVRLGL